MLFQIVCDVLFCRGWEIEVSRPGGMGLTRIRRHGGIHIDGRTLTFAALIRSPEPSRNVKSPVWTSVVVPSYGNTATSTTMYLLRSVENRLRTCCDGTGANEILRHPDRRAARPPSEPPVSQKRTLESSQWEEPPPGRVQVPEPKEVMWKENCTSKVNRIK